jgi:predicted ATPase/GAF domain-containing protein
MDLSHYMLDTLRQDGESMLCRGRASTKTNQDPSSILVAMSRLEHPRSEFVRMLEQEFALRAELDSAWAVLPVALVQYQGRSVLAFEDPGGEPLDRVLETTPVSGASADLHLGRRAMVFGLFLRIAVPLASAVGEMHRRGIIHKNLKPANVLVNASTDQVWLTGFGIASRLPRERQSLGSPETIAGTLGYMAPEQTGRMNRSIDSRSDLYSLGVTFYEMATGSLPFNASDPMEWVHCHVAKLPVSPCDRVTHVPLPVSAIIMKLLAKTAEERYQTAAGLERDLRRCLAQFEAEGRIDNFALGKHDMPDRLRIPEKLYGRTREIDTLLAAFDRIVKGGTPELVLVSGYSGIGKSSVVKELHTVLVPPRGLLASGKFDQYKRDIPYSTLAQAFGDLVHPLLGKSESELARWRDALRTALGPSGQLMVDLIPQLKLIIGDQDPVPELPPQDAQRRFKLVFRRFLAVFARPDHPLALFLDDLQWLDAGTLGLLEDLLTQPDVRHLLLIGAYRDNEVTSAHPLMHTVEAIREAGALVQEIVLPPLTLEDVGCLIADSLHCDRQRTASLAQLIMDKTAGNPFFTIQFISTLIDEGLLTFDYTDAGWRWDLSRIEAKGHTDNVVALMVGKLNRLPVETKSALQQLACLGNTAGIGTLSIILESPEEKVHAKLWEARRAELVVLSDTSYKFGHDRVHEAAYSLIAESERDEAHLRIGRLLSAHIPLDEREEAIFEIVAQFDRSRGAESIMSLEEREQTAELYLIAGKRAQTAAAYGSALKYLVSGAALLSGDCWDRRHDLIFQMQLHRAECELLTGSLATADERLATLSLRARTTVEQSAAACLRMDLYMTAVRPDRAITVCLDYLRRLGIEWSPHPSDEEAAREYEEVWLQLGRREIETLIELPLMSAPALLATLDVLTKALAPALFTDVNLTCLIACRIANLSLQHGNSDGSCLGYVWFGMTARTRFGNHEYGVKFGRLGFDLVERKDLRRFQGRTYSCFAQFIALWTGHVRICRDVLHRAFEATNKVGDLTYAAYTVDRLCSLLLAAGEPLLELQQEAEKNLAFCKATHYGALIETSTFRLRLIHTLRGFTSKFGSLTDEEFDEFTFERHLATEGRTPIVDSWYWIIKLQARFFAGDYPAALDASQRARTPLSLIPPTYTETAEYHFYSALCHAASVQVDTPEERGRHLEAVRAHQTQIEAWAKHCPENFESRAALVGAEIARIEGREFEAMRLYDRAIHSARANGFVNIEALANELASRLNSAHVFETIAKTYLREARSCYLRWGADGKVRQLETLNPGLREPESAHAGAVNLTEHGIPDRLLIPEKLYGREREVDTLLRAFDSVLASGAPEMVLFSGCPGIGKSAVVNELHKVLLLPRGLFASGKFDQYKRDIPYATLAQAFQSLVRQLLGHSAAERAKWHDDLVEALGPNGLLITDLVPELKLIIGEPAVVPELPPQEAKGRFHMVFRRFTNVFARPEHPLALFLDDLQWLDAATLDLLEDLLTHPDVRDLLLIGAYRDNEVSPDHPLIRKLDAIRGAGGRMRDVVLAPLPHESIGQLLTDALHCNRESARQLAELVHEKTAGNPFFVIHFLTALVEEGLLTFDHRAARWLWNLARIHAKGYTDNVTDLMVRKLGRLPIRTQNFLQRLACLGHVAESLLIAMIYEGSDEELRQDLQDALRTGLILHSEGVYRFLHDRVQHAAYSLLPQAQRAEAHLRIGRLLATHIPPEQRDATIFEIVNHLNRGAALITRGVEKEQLAELNLIAGKRAKASTAYVSALNYLVAGTALLSDDGWDRRPDLLFSLELYRAECEFLTGEVAAAEARLTMLASRAVNPVDQATVACLRLDLYTTLDRSDSAIDVCLDYLRHRGVEWSPHPTEEEVRREYERALILLGRREIEELIDLPLMSEPDCVATLDVLNHALSPAAFTDVNLLALILWRMVNFSLEHGNTDASCIAYTHLGIDAGPRFGNYKVGFRFGQLGYDLVERRGLKKFQARTHLAFAVINLSWNKHWRFSCDLMRDTFSALNIIGDLTFAAYSWHNLIGALLAAGDPLVDVQREADRGLEFAQKIRFGLVIDTITARLGLIRTLRGLTTTFGCFDDAQFNELQFERHLSSDPRLGFAACWYWTRKLQARFFAGDYAVAVDASLNAQRLLWTSRGFLETAEAHFYGALSHAASCDAAFPVQYREHAEALTGHHKHLVVWAENCPENFQNRTALVSAEMARLEGRELDAERLYERAIQSARANGFVNNEGLANELAARFYAARGFQTIAKAYLREARSCYLRWGANGKVRQLETLYPDLRELVPVQAGAATIATQVEQVDFGTVIKVSQAVSGEMVLERLIDALMRLAIEHAGAERGVLLLSREKELRQEAEAIIKGDVVVVRRRDESAIMIPTSVVNYVMRTREAVILDNASAHPTFSADSYIRERNAKSILCLPLVRESKLTGALYLENNLTSQVFTPSRIAVLKLLALQAATSLENSYLYYDLAKREAKIRRLVDANIIGIIIWDIEGRIIDCNDAFLRMVGYERNDITSGRLRWTELTPPPNGARQTSSA